MGLSATAGSLFYSAISFKAFKDCTFTTFRAGFALNMAGSPVKGFMPLRALVAGFRTTLILSRPGKVNIPAALRFI